MSEAKLDVIVSGGADPEWEDESWGFGDDAGGRVVAATWTHGFRAGRHELWPKLADTSVLNERLGLPVMRFEESDGRLHGSVGQGWFRQEWVELPWQWESGRSLSAERHYQRGFARAVRVGFQLSDRSGGGCELRVSIGWVARRWWCQPVLRGINTWLRLRYQRVMGEMDAELSDGGDDVEVEGLGGRLAVRSGVAEGRLARGMRELRERGFKNAELGLLAGFLRSASDRELSRIRPKVMASEWEFDLERLLTLLLHSTRSGLLRLSWDVMCPHCRGVRREIKSLGELREFDRCEVCDVDFSATAMEAIEVSFRVHPEVKAVGEVFYCSAEPAKKPHIWLQRELAAGESFERGLDLPPGAYRVRRASGGGATLVFDLGEGDVGEGGVAVRWDAGGSAGPVSRVEVGPGARLALHNSLEEPVAVVVEEVAPDLEALRPVELFNFQEFRDLFSEESIAPGLSLEIGHQTLLFTDIVGSSQLYSSLGDAEAFRHVREHFVALHDEVASGGGAMVKTIGDAMMAAFAGPADALRAAVSIQRRFRGGGGGGIRLRASIHRGVCIAVKLDSGIDYFGQAVNHAAKIQSVAGAGQIAMSGGFYSIAGIEALAEDLGLGVEEVEAGSPGAPGGGRVLRARVGGGG